MSDCSGIINFLKPAGMTSHDAVGFLRRQSGLKRIGHTGTLDPMAVGVLPLCVGSATRIIQYLDEDHKEYRCEMILGFETETQDIWGAVTAENKEAVKGITEQDVQYVMKEFLGEILQIPPIYSAVKVRGKRLYDYARQGEAVEIKGRKAMIYRLDLKKFDLATGRVTFDVDCGRGTYVRTLCHAIGRRLGCLASMSFLIRTASGPFRINEAVTAEVLDSSQWKDHLLPMDFPLGHLGKLYISEGRAAWFCNGGYLRPGDVRMEKGAGDIYAVYCNQRLLGVARYEKTEEQERYYADKVLCK